MIFRKRFPNCRAALTEIGGLVEEFQAIVERLMGGKFYEGRTCNLEGGFILCGLASVMARLVNTKEIPGQVIVVADAIRYIDGPLEIAIRQDGGDYEATVILSGHDLVSLEARIRVRTLAVAHDWTVITLKRPWDE